jgi:hypothetical protein
MKLWMSLAIVVVSSALAGGCGADVEGDCLEVCEGSKDCTETEANCKSLCSRVADEAEATECESQTNDYYACRLDNDGCNTQACDAEYGELTVCRLDFCLEHPDHELCDIDG